MISFPFDSEVTYEADGTPVYDRGSDSSILSQFFGLMFSDGVFATPEDGLLVTTSTNDMSVTVRPGNCMIQGHMAIEAYERTLVFEASGTSNDRIDAVVARLNINHDYRDIDLYVIKGTEDASPVPPALTRVGGIYEIRLANVYIPKNTSIITTDRITDTRKIEDECGTVSTTPDAYLYYKKAEIEAFLKKKQDASTAITTGNIGNQSVKYAESSGSAKNADYATSAGTATNAVNAKSAEKATTAGSATSATFATTAGNADTVDGWHLSNIQSDAQSRADNAYNGAIDEINAKDRTVLHLSGGRMTGALCMQKNDISDTYAIYAISNDCMQLLANNSIRLLHKDWGSYTDAIVDNLHYQGGLYKDSYRGAKENILPIDEKRARKVLDIPVRIFDYRPGFGNGEKDVVGEIVDEVQDIIPEAVVMPEDWDESNFNELLGDMGNEQIPGIDQTKFIPYLIAMVQLQQKQIEDLEQKVTALENE